MKTVPSLPPFEHSPKPYVGPSFEEVNDLRKRFLNPGVLTYYKQPIMLVEGSMQYLYDEKGRRYLDAFAGIVSVSCGHSHPRIVEAAQKQMETLGHTTTIYLHPEIALYGKELAEKLPGDLDCCYFVNSGSEANDLALLMVRLYTGNFDVVALRNGYHGGGHSTMGLTAHGTWKFNSPHGFGVHHAINPNPYRGAFGDDAEKYAAELKDLIQYGTPGKVAGFWAESIQGVGGAVVYSDGYLKRAYNIVREAGGLCIADEVQTGFGRCGTHYWGFETQSVHPDIVVMAKGIGNGYPLACVVTRKEIAETMTQRIHFNTYGGNPISSAVGRAVLKAIEEDGLQQNSLDVGSYLMDQLKALQEKHDIIGDVRGMGLMLGIELVKDRATKEPASQECAQVWECSKELGLLIGKGGLFGNTIRLKPPMCIHKKDVDFLVEVLDISLSEL